eukprot:CAMPEP_0180172192 /NCGR_PEP_ID=MMETSP0986-20121125/34877_1 /TAXON_ID=697907 /ORGANISM="non described non described, Strain CCMP2293" /LENGTH=36 /DNA_ID= /DNA_START= /DNA_END= /DNA_ORIENTATION=
MSVCPLYAAFFSGASLYLSSAETSAPFVNKNLAMRM